MTPRAHERNRQPKSADTTVWRAYECAQQAALHDDVIMWQVVSITWGADSILLGLTLSAFDGDKVRALPFIITPSIVGIVLTIFAGYYYYISKIRQHIAYKFCRRIEKKHLPRNLRLRHRIDEIYDVTAIFGRTRHWVLFLTVLFLLTWSFTLIWAFHSHL
jgi:hypothetical protein